MDKDMTNIFPLDFYCEPPSLLQSRNAWSSFLFSLWDGNVTIAFLRPPEYLWALCLGRGLCSTSVILLFYQCTSNSTGSFVRELEVHVCMDMGQVSKFYWNTSIRSFVAFCSYIHIYTIKGGIRCCFFFTQ